MKYRVNEFLVNSAGLLGVKESVIYIGGAAVKGGKKKPQLRGGDNLPGGTGVILVLSGEISQLYFDVF